MPKKAAPTPAPMPITGYSVRPRYREIVCDWYEEDDGEPFTATIRRNLTFDQINAIPSGSGATFAEIWEAIHPYVTAWNLTAQDLATGEVVAVPPPAEAGPDAFRALDAELNIWLLSWVRTAHLGGPAALQQGAESERKKGSTPSAAAPASTAAAS